MTSAGSEPHRRRVSFSQLLLVVPWVALVIDAWAPIRDNSFLWHIRAGELQADAGSVLTTDPFSFTMLGEEWLTQSWLAELLYAWGERVAGLGFVPVMLLVTTAITFLTVGLVAYRYSGSTSSTALVLLLTLVLLLGFLVPRPVIFSFALFALVTLAWSRPETRWAVPFLCWVWAAVHGSFILGLAYIGLTLIADREWRALPTAFVSGAATLLTAHGLGVISMILSFGEARDTLALLTEWRRPELLSAVFLPFVIGIALVVLGAWRRLIEPRHLWVIVPFFALALTATRAVPPSWLALVPLVSLSAAGARVGSSPRFSMAVAGVFGVVVALFPFFIRGDARLDETRFPLEATDALDGTPVFHDDRVGGYLIYAEGPERLVYLDDRAELYGERMAEFVDVRSGDAPWEPVFVRDGIGQALLRTDDGLGEKLTSSGWSTVYRDDHFVVLRP